MKSNFSFILHSKNLLIFCFYGSTIVKKIMEHAKKKFILYKENYFILFTLMILKTRLLVYFLN